MLVRFPPPHVRRRIVVQGPQVVPADEPVHFLAVDLRCVVIGRRSEPVAFLRARRVDERPAVADQVNAVEHCFEGQAVVVTVPTAAILSDRSAINRHVIALVPHDENAALRKRCGRDGRRLFAFLPERRRGAPSKRPEDLGARPREAVDQLRHLPVRPHQPGDIAMVVDRLAAERQRTRIIGVADERDRAVGPHVGEREPRHVDDARAIIVRHRQPAGFPIPGGQEEELEHQPVVRNRRFEVDTVWQHLAGQLFTEQLPACFGPATRRRALAEKEAGEDHPDGVGREVVAVDVGAFEVALGEFPVEEQRAQEPALESLAGPRAAPVEHVKQPRPRQDPHGDFHRAGPVHPVRVRVALDPVFEDFARRAGALLVAGHEIRLPDGDQPLQSRDFPRDLHVARASEIRVVDVAHERVRPRHARFEVAVPVDGRPEIDGAGAEEVDAVRERGRRRMENPRRIARAGPLIVAFGDRTGRDGIQAIGEPRPDVCQARRVAPGEQRLGVEIPGAPRRAETIGLGVEFSQHALKDDSGRLPQNTAHPGDGVERHDLSLGCPAAVPERSD